MFVSLILTKEIEKKIGNRQSCNVFQSLKGKKLLHLFKSIDT